MAWYSLLPSHLTVYETWVIRVCLFLAVLNLSPWFVAILYDLVLWICRSLWHEVPVVGGRAQGRIRPRRPGLVAGGGRQTSLSGMIVETGGERPRMEKEKEEQESKDTGVVRALERNAYRAGQREDS